MITPYISIIVPTNRVGGIDILMSGLRAQTFRDFELVLADGLYHRRSNLVASLPEGIVHVEVKDGLRRCEYSRYANAGLAAASGDVVLMLSDYTQLPPDSLAIHAAHHMAGGNGLMCPHDYFKLPALADLFSYGGQKLPVAGHDEHATDGDWDRYVADVLAGKLDALMDSVLLSPSELPEPGQSAAQCNAGWAGGDPKLRMPPGPLSHWFFHCKHESFRREDSLAVGGFDERLDGTNGYQDTDFAHRLSALRGVQWQLEPSNVARIFNPRPNFPHPPYERPIASNKAIYEASVDDGFHGIRSRFTEGRT